MIIEHWFHVGDYIKSTAHLDLIEDCVYRRLIDLYMETETPIPNETQQVIRRLRLGSSGLILESILTEFFTLEADNSNLCIFLIGFHIDNSLNFRQPELIVVRIVMDRDDFDALLLNAFISEDGANHAFTLLCIPRIANVVRTVTAAKQNHNFICFFESYLQRLKVPAVEGLKTADVHDAIVRS